MTVSLEVLIGIFFGIITIIGAIITLKTLKTGSISEETRDKYIRYGAIILIVFLIFAIIIGIICLISFLNQKNKTETKLNLDKDNTVISSSYTPNSTKTITATPTNKPLQSITIAPSNISTPSPIQTFSPINTPSSEEVTGATIDNNFYYIQVYCIVLDEIYREEPMLPYGTHKPYGYLCEDEIPLKLAGVSEDKEKLFDIEYKYLENGIYEFTVPYACQAISFISDNADATLFYLYESLYDRFSTEPLSYENPLRINLRLQDDFIDITWTEHSIEECSYMQNVEYMNHDSYEKFSFSSFTDRFNSRPIESFTLIPGEYSIIYSDGSEQIINFNKSGEYDFSYKEK